MKYAPNTPNGSMADNESFSMVSNEETRKALECECSPADPVSRQGVARPPTKRSRSRRPKIAFPQDDLATISPLVRDRRGENRLPVESDGGLVGGHENLVEHVERRPPVANEGNRGENAVDLLPVENEGVLVGSRGNPVHRPPVANEGNLPQRRGHREQGPHEVEDGAGPSEGNFVYTKTTLTRQGEVIIERAECPLLVDPGHLISIVARRAYCTFCI